MRFDCHEPQKWEYEEYFNAMWKESTSVPTTNWLLGIISKPKLINRMLTKCKHVSGTLRSYSKLRTTRGILGALRVNRHWFKSIK